MHDFYVCLLFCSLSVPTFAQRDRPESVPLSALGVVVSVGRSEGAEITEVVPGGAAAVAGLEPGDVINSVDGNHVKNPTELVSELSSRTAADKVQLGYLHRGAWEIKKEVVLGSVQTTAAIEVKESTAQSKSAAASNQKHKRSKPLGGYTQVLVEPFTVETGKLTKDFPVGEEAGLQLTAMNALRASKMFDQVVDGTQKATDEPFHSGGLTQQVKREVILSGTVIGFKEGNSVSRYVMWPLPVGVSEVKVRFVLRDATTDQEVLRFEGKIRKVADSRHG